MAAPNRNAPRNRRPWIVSWLDGVVCSPRWLEGLCGGKKYFQVERIPVMTTYQHTSGAELLPWNRVVTPHIDIVQGQLSMDTYAANLGKVVQGDSSVRPVYRDAHAFFEATFLTTELRRILMDVLAVLAGRSGDRV